MRFLREARNALTRIKLLHFRTGRAMLSEHAARFNIGYRLIAARSETAALPTSLPGLQKADR